MIATNAPAARDDGVGRAEMNSSGASTKPAGTLMRCAIFLKVNPRSSLSFQPFQNRVLYVVHRNIHTFPVPAASPMTVCTAPYVPAKCDIQRIKRAVTYRRCRSVKAHNWRPACCRDMKRPGVPADEQSGATRESDELLERRGKYA